ncbi:DNA helicase RecQ [Sphingobacteriales bacterium UPWRP_1]|nr:DNA helicase RecQ [Sphingobacteriales bacterium TSM_CSS]PSJ78348.1 DNA helicase RecQ [Sphingobacteriales bacterium UPWRP_1]
MNTVAEDRLHNALKEYFGFSGFKGNQTAIIKSILQGKDTLVIMPTGGGKSLCYQLPAILSEGTALIISPLIALMKNQVDLMRGYSSQDNIAHFLNSSLSRTEAKKVKEDLTNGHTKMLYIAPETLTKQDSIDFFRQLKVSFVAVDEAHCISEWGHDFRPEYRRIRKMVDAIDIDAPIMALTATATPKVRDDIIKNLQLKTPEIYSSSFNRPNLYYEIRPKGKKDEVIKQITRFIKENPNKSGIIYCLNRKTTEELAQILNANNIKAAPYHAGLEAPVRSMYQDQFLMEEIQVIVATIAFGMGIDKPDVRFVIHYNMPKSLENYYQETGRAGRDGMEGRCVGFFSYDDMTKLEKFMRDKTVAEREVGGQHLAEVVNYSELASCRRRFLLHYFGEMYDEQHCNKGCDNCTQPKDRIEVGPDIATVLNAVIELQENFDSKYLLKFLMGKKTQEIIDFRHDQLKYFGKGEQQDKMYWKSVLNHALLRNFLKKDIEKYGLLKLSAEGKDFLKNPQSVKIAINQSYDTDAATAEEADVQLQKGAVLDPALLNLLKSLRREVAKKKQVPTYVVFQDRSLEEMATYYPITPEELERINGVSKGKYLKYGRPFIEAIKKYVEENDIMRAEDFVMKSVASKSKDKIYIIQNIDKQIPLENIANYLGLTMFELITEIEKIVDSGTKLNVDYHLNNLLDQDAQEELFDYFMHTNADTIDGALKELNEDNEYSEEEIRLMRIKFISEVAH